MSTANPFDGSVFLTPDHSPGYGTAISNPATLLSGMVTNQYYFQENGDTDVVFVSAEGYLISLYKSFVNQKALQQFTVRMTSVGGQSKLRWIHRSRRSGRAGSTSLYRTTSLGR